MTPLPTRQSPAPAMSKRSGVLPSASHGGAQYQVRFNAKVKLEVVVPDDMAQKAVTASRETANTGNIGDGKIFIYDLADVVRIRTDETGEQAVSRPAFRF
jgi:nitrogen regulatory protein PII